jgi:hypothetical protein
VGLLLLPWPSPSSLLLVLPLLLLPLFWLQLLLGTLRVALPPVPPPSSPAVSLSSPVLSLLLFLPLCWQLQAGSLSPLPPRPSLLPPPTATPPSLLLSCRRLPWLLGVSFARPCWLVMLLLLLLAPAAALALLLWLWLS